jgi:hypothetical protein
LTGLPREVEIREKQKVEKQEPKETVMETVTQLSDLLGQTPLIIEGEGE